MASPVLGRRVYTLLASLCAGRVYPGVAPGEATEPRITYQIISEHHEGLLDGESGMVSARVQIDCWARGYQEAHELANDVYAAMRGSVSGWTARQIEQGDLYDPESELHRVSADYAITQQEA